MMLAEWGPIEGLDLKPNAYECVEDRKIYEMADGEVWDEDDTLCPSDDGHAVFPYLVVAKGEVPAGIPEGHAADCFHPVHDRYEFRLEDD